MPRRVKLPGADELFRGQQETATADSLPSDARPKKEATGPTGRVRHDEKITVYVSTDELLNLEQIRLRLRADHGVNVDRGRLVRVAIGMLADELQSGGDDSDVLRRLTQ
ncbi:hypothetical protein [Brooklawnia sp.]|uniref:hypothetical protein n=1 Tax=Brooklawnia sp. TaxID=2699740 RepID=UPI00311F037A